MPASDNRKNSPVKIISDNLSNTTAHLTLSANKVIHVDMDLFYFPSGNEFHALLNMIRIYILIYARRQFLIYVFQGLFIFLNPIRKKASQKPFVLCSCPKIKLCPNSAYHTSQCCLCLFDLCQYCVIYKSIRIECAIAKLIDLLMESLSFSRIFHFK